MGLLHRFFGRPDAKQQDKPVANPALERPLSLQLLFPAFQNFNSAALTASLRRYHSAMKHATFEIDPATAKQGTPLGMAGWGDHVVRLIGFDVPMPKDTSEVCIQGAHYTQALKAAGRACQSHAILYYGGRDPSPWEQYVALATVAGVLVDHGALLVLNESARTSLPAKVFSVDPATPDQMELLRHFPMLMLYAGFVKYDLEGQKGVWMKTYGCQMLGLPNLAFLASGHNAGQQTHDMFQDLLLYIRDSGAHVAAGHTLQLGSRNMRLRSPSKQENILNDTPGEFLILEAAR